MVTIALTDQFGEPQTFRRAAVEDARCGSPTGRRKPVEYYPSPVRSVACVTVLPARYSSIVALALARLRKFHLPADLFQRAILQTCRVRRVMPGQGIFEAG